MEEVYTYSAKACQEKTCYIIVASCYFETRIGMPPLSNASAFISIRLLIRLYVQKIYVSCVDVIAIPFNV